MAPFGVAAARQVEEIFTKKFGAKMPHGG